jgi:hypothetical protein
MRRITLLFIALCLSLPALAERKQSFGDLDVHYIAFNSGFLQPDIAAANGLVRSKTQGVVNISVLKAGTASSASVSGEVKDLVGRSHPLLPRAVPLHPAGNAAFHHQCARGRWRVAQR